jgi:hypothetical protein
LNLGKQWMIKRINMISLLSREVLLLLIVSKEFMIFEDEQKY